MLRFIYSFIVSCVMNHHHSLQLHIILTGTSLNGHCVVYRFGECTCPFYPQTASRMNARTKATNACVCVSETEASRLRIFIIYALPMFGPNLGPNFEWSKREKRGIKSATHDFTLWTLFHGQFLDFCVKFTCCVRFKYHDNNKRSKVRK